jgi:hypothetical protein
MGPNVNPFSPLNFLSLPTLNGDKLSFYCVWGCWLFHLASNGKKPTSSLSKLKTVIHEVTREGAEVVF